MRLLPCVAAAALVFAGAACARQQPAAGQAGLRVHDGSVVLVRRSDGPARPVAGDRMLPRRATVSVESGGATLLLRGGAALELRGGSELVVDRWPELRGGDVLALSGDRPLTLEAAATSLTVAGAARLSRSLAVSVHAYHGSVEVSSAGRTLTVPALRQATVPAFGLVPARPGPLAYDVEDAWDRRFLGLAMDLTDALQSYSEGFTALPRPAGLGPAELSALLPQLGAEPVSGDLLAEPRSPGETLVGAAVVASSRGLPVDRRWRDVFGFRDQGAVWGLVVLDQALADPSSVLAVVGEASRRSFDLGALARPVEAALVSTPSAPEREAEPAPTAASGSPAVPPPVTLPAAAPPTPSVPVRVPAPAVTLPPVTVPAVTVPAVTVPSLDPVADAVVGLVDDVTGAVPSLLR